MVFSCELLCKTLNVLCRVDYLTQLCEAAVYSVNHVLSFVIDL